MTTSPQPVPSPTPGPASPSVGATTPGKAGPATGKPGGAQPGTNAAGSSQIGSGGATTDSTQSGSTNGQAGAEQVKELQQALQDKGMDPGPIDGIMGPKTQAALRAFQQDQKLPPTGRMDDQTLAKLGVSR
jgi:peptidoglycan hydrolase-like protein with peptidoglycan-binding domain